MPRVGLIACVTGVLMFILGIYGIGPAAAVPSLGIGAMVIGALLVMAGLAIRAPEVRDSDISAPPVFALALGFAALLLHGIEAAAFGAGFLMWALFPYFVFLWLSCIPVLRVPASAAIAAMLAVDAVIRYDVFIAPRRSTAAIALLFAPLWNAVVVGPLVLLCTWAIRSAKANRQRNVP